MSENCFSGFYDSIKVGISDTSHACGKAYDHLSCEIGKLDHYIVSKIHSFCCSPRVAAIAIAILRALPWVIALQLGGIYFAVPLAVVWIVWGKNVMTRERRMNLQNGIGMCAAIEALKCTIAFAQAYSGVYIGLAVVNLLVSGVSFALAYHLEQKIEKKNARKSAALDEELARVAVGS